MEGLSLDIFFDTILETDFFFLITRDASRLH